MTQVLQLAQFPQTDRVPDMQVGLGWIEAHFEAQGLACVQASAQTFFADDFGDAAFQDEIERVCGH